MNVVNVRLAHATNSSSSHSIIFDPTIGINKEDISGGFGWNFFTAVTPGAKSKYCRAILYQNLEKMVGHEAAVVFLAGMGYDSKGLKNYDIDHQSLYTLPNTFDGQFLNLDFFKELRDRLMEDGVVILGGNDEENRHRLFNENKAITFHPYDTEGKTLRVRKDGDFWTGYDTDSGNRITFSFRKDADPADFKPRSPFLVDVKITDFCPIGCKYCYQGSTKLGEHAGTEKLRMLSYYLSEAEVFEVALGGGEPTMHPYFLGILQFFKRGGVTPNFTTKSLAWIKDQELFEEVLSVIGGFAFSISSVPELDTFLRYVNFHKAKIRGKASIQIIPATMSNHTFSSIVDKAADNGIRITLLGFKRSGRGQAFLDRKAAWLMDETDWVKLKKSTFRRLPTISIDTTLAAATQDKMQEFGVPDWLYHTEDGKFSMYVDAVEETFGPSSYQPGELRPFTKNWQKQFLTWK